MKKMPFYIVSIIALLLENGCSVDLHNENTKKEPISCGEIYLGSIETENGQMEYYKRYQDSCLSSKFRSYVFWGLFNDSLVFVDTVRKGELVGYKVYQPNIYRVYHVNVGYSVMYEPDSIGMAEEFFNLRCRDCHRKGLPSEVILNYTFQEFKHYLISPNENAYSPHRKAIIRMYGPAQDPEIHIHYRFMEEKDILYLKEYMQADFIIDE